MSTFKFVSKPERLDSESAWCSIEEVVSGNGDPEIQNRWACEYVSANRYDFSALARLAARDWYRDSDQSGEASVRIRIEDALGQVVVIPIMCELSLKVTARFSGTTVKVGTPLRPSRKVPS